jgi:Sec-independent protein translocase protein TatA
MSFMFVSLFIFQILCHFTSGFVPISRPYLHQSSKSVADPPPFEYYQNLLPTTTSTSYGQNLKYRSKPLRDLLGFGPAEIAITLVLGLILFGPETLKSLSKDVGKAAAELKEIPKTFKEGMEEGAQNSQVVKMKMLAAEKRKKRDEKVAELDKESEEEE